MVSILFYRATTLAGRAVSLWTGSPWSHVAIRFTSRGLDHELELEAHADQRSGVVIWPRGCFREADARLELPWMSDAWVMGQVLPLLGTKYGWRDIISFLIGNKRANRKGMICTELVAELLIANLLEHHNSIPGPWAHLLWTISHTPVEDLSPGELHKLCAGYAPVPLV